MGVVELYDSEAVLQEIWVFHLGPLDICSGTVTWRDMPDGGVEMTLKISSPTEPSDGDVSWTVFLKKIYSASIPWYLRMLTLFGNRIFSRSDQIKMKSYWIRVSPKFSMTCVLIRWEKIEQANSDTEGESHVTVEAGLEWCKYKDCQESAETERGKGVFILRAFGGSMALLTPWFGTSRI